MDQKILSRFKDKPKTKIAWKTMYLGLSTLFIPPLLGTIPFLFRLVFDKESIKGRGVLEILSLTMGFSGVVISLALAGYTAIIAIKAYKAGERSWILWVGIIPALLIGSFWIIMILGEILFPH